MQHREGRKFAGSAKTQIVAVGGGKGGIGKTFVSTALAITLAEFGHQVVLMDGDLGGANVHNLLGISLPPKTLYDFYLRRVSKLSEILLETQIPRLQVICGAAGTPGLANIKYWEKLKTIRQIQRLPADFVVVDLGAGMSFNEVDFFNSADTCLVVANPEPTSIQESYNFLKVALFRLLRRTFLDDPEVLALFDQSADPTHMRDSRLVLDLARQVRALDLHAGIKFNQVLNQFRPNLILNRLHDQQETLDGLSLQIAVQDLLHIKLSSWGHLAFSPEVKAAIRGGRPGELLPPNSEHRQTLMNVVQKFLLKQKVPFLPPATNMKNAVSRENGAHQFDAFDDNSEGRICSIYCPLWGNCHLQRGGEPCRMPDEEYNQKVEGVGEPGQTLDTMK